MVSINVPSNNNKISITTGTGNTGMSVSLQDVQSFAINKAKDWAEKMDGPIGNEGYSAKWHATQSAQSATEAEQSATNAQTVYEDLQEFTGQTLENLNNTVDTALTNIDNAEAEAIANINSSTTTSIENIETETDGSISEITTAKDNAIAEINATGIDGRANIDLANLSETGEKHFLNKTQITNCLLEVPQTVIYETTDNSITIKAGSIGIVPNGANIFNRQIFSNDLSYTLSSTTTGTFLVFKIDNSLSLTGIGRCSSGATNANAGLTYSAWYDTTNNIVKRYGGDTANYSQGSLPLMKVTCDSGRIISIDQVFNGFGYIGSTIWVDEGVKGLIPNSRNEDRTLKNIEFTTSQVLRVTAQNGTVHIRLNENTLQLGNLVYDEAKNINTVNGAFRGFAVVGTVTGDSNNVVTSFNIKSPFRAMDYNDAVKKAGDTMTGALTMEALVNLKGANNNIDITSGTAPSTSLNGGWIMFKDKNNQTAGHIFNQHNAGQNSIQTNVQATRIINGATKTANLSVCVDGAGNTYATAPTPAADDNSTKIATTAFCANRRCTTKATTTSSASVARPAWIVQNYVNGYSWYRVWSDGWIEQGGLCTRGTNVTYLKVFSNNNYTLVASGVADSTSTGMPYNHLMPNGKSATGFTGTPSNAVSLFWYACGY